MSEHPNVTAIRRINDHVHTGDFSAMLDSVTDDVVWHEIGSADPIVGRDALAARWRGMADAVGSGGSFVVEVHDTVGNDDHVVSLVTATVGEGADAFSYRTAEIYHLRDGKISERWAFSDDTARISAFFAG